MLEREPRLRDDVAGFLGGLLLMLSTLLFAARVAMKAFFLKL